MRFLLVFVLLGCFAVSGCAGRKHKARQPAVSGDAAFAPLTPDVTTTNSQKVVVTPENALVGRVATVNGVARFVVLTFPPGRLPALEQRLNLYRKGLKVGEVKVTGPQTDENIVADIVAGDAEVTDEVRDK